MDKATRKYMRQTAKFARLGREFVRGLKHKHSDASLTASSAQALSNAFSVPIWNPAAMGFQDGAQEEFNKQIKRK